MKVKDVKIKFVKAPIIHFTNPRKPKKTMCGHLSTIPGRSYSNVTSRINKVTCTGCLNAMRSRKWLKKMIEEKNSQNMRSKDPRKAVDAIIAEVAKAS